MLLALIIGAAAVVAFICSFATFLQYMREEADDDGNSNDPSGVSRVRSVAEGQALGTLARDDRVGHKQAKGHRGITSGCPLCSVSRNLQSDTKRI
jgi:hypothetical protein